MQKITGAEQQLDRLFRAKTIAIVGASNREGALNWWPLHLLKRYGFEGRIYPVNPNYDEVQGLSCYASIDDIGEPIDVAMLAINAERVPAAAMACADAGVGTVVVPSQGLGEMGPEGKAREQEMATYLADRGTRLAGPNADGVGSLATGALTTIQPLFQEGFEPGPLAVITQSGATAGSLLKRLQEEGLGAYLYASTGNEADLGIEDYLSYAVQQPDVRMVVSFLESVRRPDDFRRAARLAADLGKPIVLIKVGSSEQGAKRAAAHTGSLAGQDNLYDAFLRDCGVIRVTELSELVATAKFYLACGSPRSASAGIMSVSGGQAGMMADKAVREHVDVPEIERDRQERLDGILAFGTAINPCDLTGEVAKDPTLAASVYAEFSEQADIGTVIYGRKQLTGDAGVLAAKNLVEELRSSEDRCPLAIYAMDGGVEGEERDIYEVADVPIFTSLVELFTAIRVLGQHRRPASAMADSAASPLAELPVAPDGVLHEHEGRDLMSAYGITVTQGELASGVEQALAAADRVGYPVVLKVVSRDIPHKSDVGGVAVGIADETALREALAALQRSVATHEPGAEVVGYSIQEQADGVEAIVGVTVDEHLGPFVMVGLGGVLTELLEDVSLRPAPVDLDAARAMIAELRGAALFDGYRGAAAADVDALAQTISDVSRFAADHSGRLREADLNPVFVRPRGGGVRVADTLIVTAPGGKEV